MRRLLSTHIQHLILTGAGITPTIPNPVTSSPSDSTWVAATDIMQGEWAHNITDDIWYYRKADNTIAQIPGSSSVINQSALIDGASIAANCGSFDSKMFYLDSARTAINPITFSNVGKIWGIAINKQSASDLVITFAGANMVFEIYDVDNNCYTVGTNVTLSGAANKGFELSFIITGLTSGANSRVFVTGTYASFA